MCSSSSETALRRWLIPFFSSGVSSATLAAISDFHRSLEPRRRELALLRSQVEPRRADLGAVEYHQRIAALDFLAQHGMDLADDSRGAGAHLDLPVRLAWISPTTETPVAIGRLALPRA